MTCQGVASPRDTRHVLYWGEATIGTEVMELYMWAAAKPAESYAGASYTIFLAHPPQRVCLNTNYTLQSDVMFQAFSFM